MKLEKIYSNGIVGTIYLLLQSPALALAIWSFKLNKNLFTSTPSSPKYIKQGDKIMTTGRGIMQHQTNGGILGAGVCMLGKFAGWSIIFQTLFTNIILYTVNTKNEKYKNTILGVVIINSILLVGLAIGSTIMNRQLLVRTLPFYFLQAGCIFYLLTIYYLIRRKEELNIKE